MAKRVKFPLKMKDGVLVRTLEELQEHFDLESLAEHYESGRLLTWLEDHYYDAEVQKVSALNGGAENLAYLLCEALGIEIQEEIMPEIDLEYTKRRLKKLEYLKSLTSDETILSKVDDIALNQDDLLTLIDLGKHVVYLCKGDFRVPVSVPNMTYIGIFAPCAVVRATDNVNFKAKNIVFENMAFIWDVSGVSVNDRSFQAEQLFMAGRYEESAGLCRELVKEDNPRAIMLLYRISLNFLCDDEESVRCRNRGVELNAAYSLIDANEWRFIGRYQGMLRKVAKSGTSFDKFYYGFALYKWGFYNGNIFSEEMIPIYLEAAKLGNPCAYSGIGSRYQYGAGVKQDYHKAMEWYQKAATQNHTDAQYSIGQLYDNGQGVNQDYQKAMEWYQKAAARNDICAQYRIGQLYDNGQGVNQDYQKAMEWYQKAAAKNYAVAQNNIGELYYYGNGVNQDYQKAMEWYQKAAAQNYGRAQSNIGELYYYGKGVNQDYQKAMEWYQKAAAQNHAFAQYSIGWLYEKGQGVNPNIQKAKEWYRKAADNGNTSAKECLQRLGSL